MDVRCDYTVSGPAVAGLRGRLDRVKSQIQVFVKDRDSKERGTLLSR